MAKTSNLKIEPQAFRVNDACALLQISRSTLYGLVARGELRLIKIANRTLVPASEIARIVGAGAGGAR